MRRLILVRHAKSSWTDPGLPDFDRPLNQRGRRDAPLMGQRLAETGWLPDRIVASPAQRARDTARLLAVALGYPEADIAWEPAIYEAEAHDLLAVVRRSAAELATIMLVGHNPGITDLTTLLTGRMVEAVPTAGIVRLSVHEASTWRALRPGHGRLIALDSPKRPG